MDYSKLLKNIDNEALNKKDYSHNLKEPILNNIKVISKKAFNQKGVFTVLITLLIYKIKHPKQDIRFHQVGLKNGFSGRSIDTKYITPTLKEIGLPSMSESGWLTRSLEQPYPYTLNYEGKISNKDVKRAFLEIINEIQINNINPKYILVELFKQVIQIEEKNRVNVESLKNSQKLTISKVIDLLYEQFKFDYKVFGGSKLPVLAFFAIYQIIINEFSRYNNCSLKELGSHTSSDKNSKSAGDIEIFKKNNLFEVIEIKLNKPINANILRIVKDKILKFNPQRYYIFSFDKIDINEKEKIEEIIDEVKKEYGCQIIVNGVIETLKYYLRLIENLEVFYSNYSKLIFLDKELKAAHKQKFNELTLRLNYEL